MSRTSTLYLLHFEPKYTAPIAGADRVKVADHYLGSTAKPVDDRLAEHLAGHGSPLVRAAHLAGCTISVAATGRGGKTAERQLKRRHHHSTYCPVCSSSPKPLEAASS